MTAAGGNFTVALLGLGEVGTALARGFGGVSRVDALDAALRLPGRREVLTARARELGLSLHEAPGAWLGEADLVISAVKGAQLLAAAREAAPFLSRRALYLDLNTAASETKQLAAGVLAEREVRFVDGAIMGSVQASGWRVPIILSGEAAASVVDRLAPFGFELAVVDAAVGSASMIKLLRSVFMKGMEALAVEWLSVAEQLGLRETALRGLRDIDGKPIRATIEMLVTTHVIHAARRGEEVGEVEALLRSSGFSCLLPPAVRSVFARTSGAGATAGAAKVTLPDALARLAPLIANQHAPSGEGKSLG